MRGQGKFRNSPKVLNPFLFECNKLGYMKWDVQELKDQKEVKEEENKGRRSTQCAF